MKKKQVFCDDCYALNKKGWCRFGIPIYYERDKKGVDTGHMPMAPCTPVATKEDFDLIRTQDNLPDVRRLPYVVEYYTQKQRKKNPTEVILHYRWRVVAPNTKIVIPPESHQRIRDVRRAAENVADIFKNKYVCYRILI